MPCHIPKSRSVSARRHYLLAKRRIPPIPPLAVLDLEKPGERSAHNLLLRATSDRDGFWRLLDMGRQVSTLLCIVRWVHSEDAAAPFSLVEVSLTETALCWRDYATADAAYMEMNRRCEESIQRVGSKKADS